MKLGRILMKTVIRVPLIIWALAVLYPIIWMFLGAFKSNGEIFASPWSLPKVFNFHNFVSAWTDFNIGTSFLNSIFVTVLGTILSLCFALPTSYAIERLQFRGSKVLFNLYLSAMMIPMVLGWIPLFFLLLKFHMIDNLWALSLIYAVTQIPFSVFILTSFLGTIPKQLEESAAIDGLSPYGILFRIVTPLMMTGIITVSIMNAVNFWNEYFMAMIFLQTDEHHTLGVAMDLMNQQAQYTNAWGALFAGLSIAIIPIIIVYAIFQRQITKGMTEGAVKG
ncbi:N-acetylglucosamine transport system permease protein [Pullulanibacillus pueri]|uniref:Putative ABC transporter permease protein YurM n=1 Tax=Pullulanibacillus pueri TaxID=1437324 RepID=A0A8J2ZTF2_9BACL|nr:carbohydrate ABC transporter permease [Pullulanibacillus pueri]MBM7681859.1 N-acetylglucosamine transport system permease protein [Pullulanibacillus pueri]GGH76376.1 putative ABC transporter permease protein YurM [Pullulanibacillus pueri]